MACGRTCKVILDGARSGNDIFEIFLRVNNLNINCEQNHGLHALMLAIKNGEITAIKTLIQAGVDVNRKDFSRGGKTPLLLACEQQPDRVLSDSGIQVIVCDETEQISVLRQCFSCFRCFLTGAVDVRQCERQETQNTPTVSEYLQCVKMLLQSGANIEHNDIIGKNALMAAAQKNNLPVLEALLQKGADPTRQDRDGSTALMLTIDSDCVTVLLQNGADMEESGVSGRNALMLAAHKNNLPVLKIFLEAGADAKKQDKEGRTALMLTNDTKCVRTLLNAGGDVEQTDKEGRNALMIAGLRHNLPVLEILLESGADPNKQDKKGIPALLLTYDAECAEILLHYEADIQQTDADGKSILMRAAKNGNLPVLVALLERGTYPLMLSDDIQFLRTLPGARANIEYSYDDGNDLLMTAVQQGHIPFLRALLDLGVNSDQPNFVGRTALMIASDSGNAEVVKTLLGNGADPNTQNCSGKTALMLALARGQNNMIITKALLECGGDPNKYDNCGRTALMIASLSGQINIVQVLLKRGADPNKQDNEGKTALMIASLSGQIDVMPVLLDRGADPNKQDNEGKTALMIASQGGQINIMPVLLQRGADPNKQDNEGKPALMIASQGGQINIMPVLLDRGADPNKQDNEGKTALMIASLSGQIDVMPVLLDRGADPNKQDNDGKTALMIASQGGQIKIVRVLLDRGADPNKQDNEGKTALMCAHDPDCLMLLLDLGANPDLLDELDRTIIVHWLQELARPGTLWDPNSRAHANFIISVLMERGATPIVDTLYRGLLYKVFVCMTENPESDFNEILWLGVNNGLVGNDTQTVYDKTSLQGALDRDNIHAVKYIFACCYITSADVQLFRRVISEHQTQQPVLLTQSDRLTQEGQVNVVNFLRQAMATPFPLVKLAFIAVSSVVRSGTQREERVKQTGLPPILQRMLMFQTPASRLPVSQWSNISLSFDPVQYETLPRPRPLLYYWPFGRQLDRPKLVDQNRSTVILLTTLGDHFS